MSNSLKSDPLGDYVITVPMSYARMCKGNLNQACVLQVLVGCAREQKKEAWFCKPHKEVSDETGLGADQVRYAVAKLRQLLGSEIIEVKIKKVNGAPTAHYKINEPALLTFLAKEIGE